MKMGVIQGRLSRPTNGFQECPHDWQREFNLLHELGLTHVEWIITKNSFAANPFFTEDLGQYSIGAVCADNLVDDRIDDAEFLEDNLIPICDACVDNGLKNITVPLLEESDMFDDIKREQFIGTMIKIGSKYSMLNFSFEIESVATVIADIVNHRDNFYFTYDTGNMTTIGIDHTLYLNTFYKKINNVHLKDRNDQNKTVEPGCGSTDFMKIFSLLKSKGYDGAYTMQTARAEPGNEVGTILKHKRVLEIMYEQSI